MMQNDTEQRLPKWPTAMRQHGITVDVMRIFSANPCSNRPSTCVLVHPMSTEIVGGGRLLSESTVKP